MYSARLFTVVLLNVWAIACGDPDDNFGDFFPPPRVGVDPPDLSSLLGATEPRLVLTLYRDIRADEIAALQSALFWRSAAGTPIPFTTRVESAPSTTGGYGVDTSIVVVPQAEVTAGWTEFGVSVLPAGWATMSLGWSPSSPVSVTHLARIRTDDAPVLRTIHICGDQQKRVVVLDLSQDVAVPGDGAGPTPLVSADQSPCIALWPRNPTLRDIEFDCKSTGVPDVIHVDLAGLNSTLGTPVSLWATPATRVIDLTIDRFEADSSGMGDSCLMFRF